MVDDQPGRSISKSFFAASFGSVKKWFVGCSAAVFFGLAILVMSFFAVTQPQAHDDENNEAKITPTPAVKVEYYLPYPGILPDSPVYKLKALRDKWRLMTIFDPIKKANHELLLSDKRMSAAAALIDGGQAGLGVTTASKAEKYLEQAATTAMQEANKGKDVKSLLLSLSKAALKHEEMIQHMTQKTSGADSQALEAILATTRMVQQTVGQALLEN